MKHLWKKTIGIILAASMTLGMMPAMAMADESKAATIGTTEYDTVQAAVSAAVSGDTVKVQKSVTEDIVVSGGKDITLDLNGQFIANNTSDTITVDLGAALTITGSGELFNQTEKMATLYNNGTTHIRGGYLTTMNTDYVTILNHGVMDISAGASVISSATTTSAVIENGYHRDTETDARTNYVEGTNNPTPSLTINGGIFSGGLDFIRNFGDGVLVINDGEFSNSIQSIVNNWNLATIHDGVFFALYSTSDTEQGAILNGSYGPDSADKGILNITGGCFVSSAPAIRAGALTDSTFGDIEVTGGLFNTNGSIDQRGVSAVQVSIKGGDWSTDPSAFVQSPYATVKESKTSYAVSDGSFRNIAGDTRYDTMKATVKMDFNQMNGIAILVSGENFPDALSAAALSGIEGATIILTEAGQLSAQAKDLFERLQPSKIFVVGGEKAISETVVEAAAKAANTPMAWVTRIAGEDRAATAVKVYQSSTEWSKQCIITTGKNFPDALSISSYAYAAKCPIFMTKDDGTLDDATAAAIKAGGFVSAVILGGTEAVSESVVTQCGFTEASTVRLGGNDRYATSSKIAEWVTGATDGNVQPLEKLSYNSAFVVTGEDFPDAMAATSLAGQKGAVMLLTADSDTGATVIKKNMQENKSDFNLVYVIGGLTAVPQAVRDQIANTLTQ